MTTPTVSLTLVCPVCRTVTHLEPQNYTERPCQGCGHGLVLRGGARQGSIYVYPYLAVRCKRCGHVSEPQRSPDDPDPACPHCSYPLWAIEVN